MRKKTLKFERSKSSFHDSMCVCVCVCVCFLDEFLMNPALLFIVERRKMVVVQLRIAVENFW